MAKAFSIGLKSGRWEEKARSDDRDQRPQLRSLAAGKVVPDRGGSENGPVDRFPTRDVAGPELADEDPLDIGFEGGYLVCDAGGCPYPDGIAVCHSGDVAITRKERASKMKKVTIIGVDLAKRVFQAHGAAAGGSVVFRKKLSRAQLLPFLAQQSACTVAMEACATSHYWGREIEKLGHAVKAVPPIYVKPFVSDRRTMRPTPKPSPRPPRG